MVCDIKTENCRTLLLDALRCALRGEKAAWGEPLSDDVLAGTCRLAREHGVLPLLAEAIFGTPAAEPSSLRFEILKNTARDMTISQAQSTAEFGLLYDFLCEKGLRPAVIKGIVLRDMYKNPHQRVSVDEDLLVPAEDMERLSAALFEYGLERVDPEDCGDYEVTFRSFEMRLYIEAHTELFPKGSAAYGDCAAALDGALGRCVTVRIGGREYLTLAPTDHFLYLLLHAYKHFLHGGVGIRQICDICLFSERYSSEIDFGRVEEECAKLRLTKFCAALLDIGRERLGLCPHEVFAGEKVDCEPLLRDVLEGGSFGTSSVDRAHSSNMTLDAVAAKKRGRRSGGALRSVFLPRSALIARYPYLKKYPALLPIAWAQRIHGYVFGKKRVSPKESIRIGRERKALLREYGIIE